MSVRVLLVDDDALVRSALRMVLGGADDVEVLGEAEDGAAAVRLAGELAPDVVLMDLRMPGTDGLAATEALLRDARDARDEDGGRPPAVLVLTTFDTDEHVLRALRAGATGFLLKDTPPALIVEAVRAAAEGTPVLSPSVTRLLIARATGEAVDERAAAALAQLDEHERRVVAGVGRGSTNAEIGAELGTSPAAVKAQVSRLMGRLEVGGRVQLAVLARDAGLL